LPANQLFKHILKSPLLPAGVVLAVAAILGLVPPFARDELNDHLLLPALWLEHGLLWRDKSFALTAYPPLADLPYLLFSHQPWDWASSLWHATAAALTLLVLNKTLLNLQIEAPSRRWALLIWACTPVVVVLCTWSYVDLWLCLIAAAFIERLSRDEWSSRDALIFGLLLGLGILIKYNGIALAAAAIVALLWRWRKTPVRAMKYGAYAGLTAILVSGWWYGVNYLELGHPLYPMGQGQTGVGWLQYRVVVYGEPFIWAILAPLRAFFWGVTGNPVLFDGMLNPLYLLMLPAAWMMRHSNKHGAIAIAVVAYLLIAFTASARARYLLPAAVMMLPLAAVALTQISAKWRGAILTAAFLPVLFSNYLYINELSPWLFWQKGREAYLNSKLPAYELEQWASEQLPENAEIYLLWMGGRAYYLQRPFLVDTVIEGDSLKKALLNNETVPFSHLIMRRDLAERTLGQDLPNQWHALLKESCILAKKGNYELWKMARCSEPLGE